MRLVTRDEWGARPPESTYPIGDVDGCTIHWNGPPVGAPEHSECDGIVRSFQDYHMDVHGWSDIGYNFVVCQHGYVFEGRGLGVRGAHEEDLNADWYGIQAMVGQGDAIPAAIYDGLRAAILYCRRGGAGSGINGHRDADATACPGDELYAWTRANPMDEENDMPLTREDVDRIAAAVWHWDGIKTPDQWRDEDNPQWQAGLALSGAWQQATTAREQAHQAADNPWLWDMTRKIYDLLCRIYDESREDQTVHTDEMLTLLRTGGVDEQKLAARLLDGLRQHLTVEELARTVREGLGAELAANLAARLAE